MGRFGIGARVRDIEGDLGTIIDKKPGVRLVRYDKPGFGEPWWRKALLKPVAFQLELGKSYVDRDGTQHGPLIANQDGQWVGTHTFIYDGR